MTITLRPEQEELVREIIETGAFQTAEEAVGSALEMLRSQNEWLLANREAIDARIRQGIAELDRGESIPEDRLEAYLGRLKAEPE